MRVLITGVDGYLGWPLAAYLADRGHDIAGIDNFSRRKWVAEMGSHSIVPIAGMPQRLEVFRKDFGRELVFIRGDLCEIGLVRQVCREWRPDAIVHLGEQPSAAFSMQGASHAVLTQRNNIVGTLNLLHAMHEVCPEAHLVKLGSMGEYGTPDSDIPEGAFPDGTFWCQSGTRADSYRRRGNLSGMMFPRQAGSWYHQSKVHDTHNIEMACRIWGLCSTDVMQGVVYGTWTPGARGDEDRWTRFDVDECFGTIVNRFVAQAIIDQPLTVYGAGGQTRGFLPLRESLECLTIALENPPEPGEYRTFNQFASTYSAQSLAGIVRTAVGLLGINVEVSTIPNPRIEQESHEYEPDHERLEQLGYCPSLTMTEDIKAMFQALTPHRDRIEQVKAVLLPRIGWK